ncbi:UNVERIFIED_CONTAM: hypothetical protein Slati_4461300 [Sesamum latifolium]|uniref:Chromo domain-containing protein n=1 Tax=Sesamum latifolium TaxID=2727402 RepID=A0AAW2STH1_9LAMI
MSLSCVSMPKRALPPTRALLKSSLDSNLSSLTLLTPHKKLHGESSEADEEVCRSKPLHRVQCGRPGDGEGPGPEIIEVIKGEGSSMMQKYVGPLPIMKRIGTVAYRIELPSWWKIHNVFHVSQLKKYLADREDDARNQPSRPQLELTKTEEVAEAILNHRVTRTAKREHTEYLVKWKGCSSEENTWERVTNLKAFLPLWKLTMLPMRRGRRYLRWGRMSRPPAHSAPLTHIRPLNRSIWPINNLHRQTLDFRSLRVLGVGLSSYNSSRMSFTLLLIWAVTPLEAPRETWGGDQRRRAQIWVVDDARRRPDVTERREKGCKEVVSKRPCGEVLATCRRNGGLVSWRR